MTGTLLIDPTNESRAPARQPAARLETLSGKTEIGRAHV